MADVDDVFDIELCDQLGDVGGIGVHLVAGVCLGGAPVSAAVMSDDAVAVLKEEHHLGVPVVCGEGPAMVKPEYRSFAPVFVVDRSAVFRCDVRHSLFSLFFVEAKSKRYERLSSQLMGMDSTVTQWAASLTRA